MHKATKYNNSYNQNGYQFINGPDVEGHGRAMKKELDTFTLK